LLRPDLCASTSVVVARVANPPQSDVSRRRRRVEPGNLPQNPGLDKLSVRRGSTEVGAAHLTRARFRKPRDSVDTTLTKA
jgi:hypothetical protein